MRKTMISCLIKGKNPVRTHVGLLILVMILVWGWLSSGSLAAVFDVDRNDDADVSTCSGAVNDCTLRGAVNAANGNVEADTINIPATITSIVLTTALPTVTTVMVIIGPGADTCTISSSDGTFGQLVNVDTGGDLDLSGVTISNGNGSLDVSTLSGSNLNYGGGVYLNGGEAALDRCTISGNKGYFGGGVYAGGSSSLYLSNSTLSDNQAKQWGGGVATENGSTKIVNCTIFGNSAGQDGGGVYAGWSGSHSLSHSTVAGNDASQGAGAYDSNYRMAIRNCILADNTTGEDVGGNLSFDDYNLIENYSEPQGLRSATTHHITGVDPLLEDLAYNGGTTKTMALKFGSPAKDAGICTDTDDNPVTTDQRGRARPSGSACDIGAYELTPSSGTGPMELLLMDD